VIALPERVIGIGGGLLRGLMMSDELKGLDPESNQGHGDFQA